MESIVRGLTGKISKLKDDSKRRAILKLKLAIEPYTPEQKLWFRVIEQAIEDLGHKQRRHRSDYFFTNPRALTFICEHLNTDASVIFRTLKSYEVL